MNHPVPPPPLHVNSNKIYTKPTIMQIFLWILSFYLMYKLLVFNFLVELGFELVLYQCLGLTNRGAARTAKNIYYLLIVADLIALVVLGIYNKPLYFWLNMGCVGLSVGILMGSGEAMEKYINEHAQKRPWDAA